MVLKSPRVWLIALAALASVAAFAAVPRDGLHPLALLASLLPLQIAALIGWLRPPPAFRGVAPRPPGLRPPASG